MVEPLEKLAEVLREVGVGLPTPGMNPGATSEMGGGITESTSSRDVILHMDNLQAMASLPDASIDFIYLDPPFASDATYWHEIHLPGHTIRQLAYSDSWPDGLGSYLAFLVPRLAATRRILKPTGSICVHLDSHSSHYVKIALDTIFGAENLINEVIWRYGKMSNTKRRFPQNHDTLLLYGATPDWYFSPIHNAPSEYRTRFLRDLTDNRVLYGSVKHRSDKLITRRIAAKSRDLGRELRDDDVLWDFDTERKVQDDVFTDISIVRGNAREGTGYDTQKPQKLLERLITAFCPEGGAVADFFCGSGTTGAAASTLGRPFVLTDINLPAIQVSRLRLPQAAFDRDPALTPPSFLVDTTGAISDFRLDDLGLGAKDKAVVAQLLVSDPQSLIAGHIGETVIDVFGREATRPR
ncbi:MAG: site-specific DNA-methyltransferase [Thermomicrobiales bacterium]|nr:site-specific DNA-methyltransferase [Thermomicrobiales bacterium]